MKKYIGNRVEEKCFILFLLLIFVFVVCLFVFLLLLLLLLLFLNEYVTMNFSERPGINALKTTLTMLVKEHRKYHFKLITLFVFTVILFVYLLPPELKVGKRLKNI